MASIFEGWSSLISLYISNFDFVEDSFSKEVFNNLNLLEYLELSNIKINFTDLSYLFSDLPYFMTLILNYTNLFRKKNK